jgi:hypothetical protein
MVLGVFSSMVLGKVCSHPNTVTKQEDQPIPSINSAMETFAHSTAECNLEGLLTPKQKS